MKTKDHFTVATTMDETQISGAERDRRRASEEQQRNLKIARIENPITRREANTMMNEREDALQEIKDLGTQKIDERAEKLFRQRSQPKQTLDFPPPGGAKRPTQQEIRQGAIEEAKNQMQPSIDKDVEASRNIHNEAIDRFVGDALEKQKAQQRSVGEGQVEEQSESEGMGLGRGR